MTKISPSNTHSTPFVHLRLHTEFSIKDGLVTIGPLIEELGRQSIPTVAITDLANLFGLIKFYTAAEKAGIKALCGCDVQVKNEQGQVSQLVLLAKNRQGYLHLTRLVSELYTEAEGVADPELPISKLEQYSDGLVALSGALSSDIAVALLAGDSTQAATRLSRWQQIFPDSFYLELQRIGKNGEEDYIRGAIELAAAHDCPVVATNDVRFLTSEEFEAHEVRVCINDSRILGDESRPRNYTDQQYLKSSPQMHELFADLPEAIENSLEIAKRCTLSLQLGQPSLPNYPIPENETLEDYLCSRSMEGLQARLGWIDQAESDEQQKPYYERLEMELSIINKMGFAGYFLIVMEFIQWAKKNDIPVGPGRGSGAGSIVAYALGITDIDPMRYDLLFERFLNPERVSMPDFDVDFCMDGRDRVIQHVAELYGKDAVAQIITFGTMAARAVVRDVARVQGKPYMLADKIAKLIPGDPGMTLSRAFEEEPRLGEFVNGDEDAQEVMDMAYKLEGITRNVGKHAGGVVIAPTQLTDFTPLYCEPSGDSLVTQFDKNDVETAGLVKFDFLGLRTLTIIDWSVKMINAKLHDGEERVNINALSLNDIEVYKLIQRAETTAVFQLESHGIKELMGRLAPNSFDDIVALVALYRPGPLQSGMVDDFIERKHGRIPVQYPHPELEPVLANTYGVILYQEQVMQIAQVLASYTLGGADILRKAMGKKDPNEMARQRNTFIEGATARQINPVLANQIFDLMEKFAGYGFNKSHSVAYALVAYQTAWLKAHHPACFMAAVLSVEMQQADKLLILIEECKRMGLNILPPDVNVGEYQFTVNADGDIVYGLGGIKGLGSGQVDALIAVRGQASFASLLDLCQRVDTQSVNKRCLESLIASGAMDNLVE
ncbi:MAG: DNA polymerase III subunit alpha, partial [Gammaproteobacteria bacterium]|nr:DNA polymerase III subunit alpha [Gammaproteobacteria bacterium]